MILKGNILILTNSAGSSHYPIYTDDSVDKIYLYGFVLATGSNEEWTSPVGRLPVDTVFS